MVYFNDRELHAGLERYRIALWALNAIRIVLFVLVFIWLYEDTVTLIPNGIAFFVGAGLVSLVVVPIKKRYEKTYKEHVVEPVLREEVEALVYMPAQRLRYPDMLPRGLIVDGDSCRGSDYIEGIYKGIQFMQSHLTVERDSFGRRSGKQCCYNGRWMVFWLPQAAPTKLALRDVDFPERAPLLNQTGQTEYKYKTGNKLFDKAFSVAAEDPVAGGGMLTRELQDAAVYLRGKVDGYLLLCFQGDELHVGWNDTEDSFAPIISEKRELEAERQRVRDVIGQTKMVIDYLVLGIPLPGAESA